MSKHHKQSKAKQKQIANHIDKTDTSAFYNLLNGPEFSDTLSCFQPKHRERIYTPSLTLSMFISQVLVKGSSCQKVVDDFAMKRLAAGLSEISTRTGAYCKARQGLPLDFITNSSKAIAQRVSEHIPARWQLKGRNSYVADGTTMLMPDTEENQAAFPQASGQKGGVGFPICRMVAITCLETGALINSAIAPYSGKKTGETSLLRNMLNSLNKGDILLGDSLYSAYFMYVDLMQRGVDFLFEQNGAHLRTIKLDKKLGKKFGKKSNWKDHIIQLEKPKKKPEWLTQEAYDNAPENLLIREFKAGKKVLVTSMLCAKEMPKNVLGKHYEKRWTIEVDLRNIKTTMGMDMLSCKTPEMVIKEIAVYLLAYNIIRLLMLQSALISDILPREISFKHCINLWQAWCQQVGVLSIEKRATLFKLIAEQRVGNRPGRIEPRAIKRRPKSYPLLMKPRWEYQLDIRENGHPKK